MRAVNASPSGIDCPSAPLSLPAQAPRTCCSAGEHNQRATKRQRNVRIPIDGVHVRQIRRTSPSPPAALVQRRSIHEQAGSATTLGWRDIIDFDPGTRYFSLMAIHRSTYERMQEREELGKMTFGGQISNARDNPCTLRD
ncbi:hypothetical protein OPT61_g4574 [Boeremia exigua]|uniref:Uncharacterized protein n=1 Tax=Boeremia exigua TaxID=749465 RepID=A0ACC2IDM8_9PLEO|nr:hypothetical protein OPT61_g4574 [Boeremia exigua]